jgi:uncharacterized protein (DUF1810 family)
LKSEDAVDPYDLGRFVEAQEKTYWQAFGEIRAGDKRSHWMWFVFPQLAGLGSSPMARKYAIQDLAEAVAYLRHPVLGPRLDECVDSLLGLSGKTAHEIFGSPDDWKLRSCATLFSRVTPAGSRFERLLETYFEGRPDERTLELLASH